MDLLRQDGRRNNSGTACHRESLRDIRFSFHITRKVLVRPLPCYANVVCNRLYGDCNVANEFRVSIQDANSRKYGSLYTCFAGFVTAGAMQSYRV
jgi:hypothetical protein